jgi:tight adherence protein B
MAAAGIFLLFWSLKSTIESKATFEERFETLTRRRDSTDLVAAPEEAAGLTAGQMLAGAVEKTLVRPGYAGKVKQSLARADAKVTVGEYMVARALSAGFGGIIGYILGNNNTLIEGMPIPFIIVCTILGYFLPRVIIARRAGKRLKAFNDQLPDTVQLISSALRSGNSVAQAMALASREAPQPTNIEFARVVAEISLGIPPEESLSNLLRRVPSEDLDMMITAMNVSAQVGGNLSEVLDKIGETIRQRVRLKGDIATLTAQQQGAGYIVSVLPALIGLVMFLLNGAYMRPMFAGFPYLCMPICAGLMIFLGFMAMKKITDIKV